MTDRSEPSGGQRDSEGLQFLIHKTGFCISATSLFSPIMNWREGGLCVTVDVVVVISLGLFFTLCSVICGIPISLTQACSEVAMCACNCQNEFMSQA